MTTGVVQAMKKQRWKMLLVTMFCYLFFYTGRHNFGWAAHQLADTLHISYERVGWISFSMLVSYALGQLINGNLADRFSPKHMITMGGLLSVAANVLISFSDSFVMILILWSLNGYFQSMAWASGSRIISNWWTTGNRGLAFGLYTMAAGLSSVITYLMSILLVHESWRNLFRIPVLFLAVAVIIFFLLVKNGPDTSDADAGDTPRQKPGWKQGYLEVLSNRRFLVVCLALGFQSMARYALIFWLPLYFLGTGLETPGSQVWISLLLPVGMATGAIAFGFMSDWLFRSNRIISISFGMGICSLLSAAIYFINVKSGITIATLVFLAGFFSYGPQANFWPLAPELLGQRYVGTGTGIMNMVAYVFAAIGEPVMGKFIDATGNKAVIFIVVTVIAMLSALTILLTGAFAPTKINEDKSAVFV
ncbi:MFS transporter [Chitinophaga arvensicola]|uniref:MFS transporter, OPA family, glycerol-3-phosphate transporter n=1 Tax=Chitinophaga arvensicola TaxID=29529 RepID=A0A1I0S9A5_9BACT|nr:MFS transporter [Chitinophaga arvensicola]SEW52741.1 MFS transporter, OPA family, glycerol-3-phosphate transporter [Chitinophaga arvensicola]